MAELRDYEALLRAFLAPDDAVRRAAEDQLSVLKRTAKDELPLRLVQVRVEGCVCALRCSVSATWTSCCDGCWVRT